jgi:hypothetical protein
LKHSPSKAGLFQASWANAERLDEGKKMPRIGHLCRVFCLAVLTGVTGSAIAMAQGKALLTVALTPAGTVPKGQSLTVIIDHANLPSGAGLVLSVEPQGTSGPQPNSHLVGSVIVLRPHMLSGSGQWTYLWNQQRLGCAPTDIPKWCDSLEIGRYRLVARAYDRADFAVLGWADRPEKSLLAEAVSAEFTVTGTADLRPLDAALTDRLVTEFVRQTGVHSAGVDVSPYLNTTTPLARVDGRWCKTLHALQPFIGHISVCVPSAIVGDFGVDRTALTTVNKLTPLGGIGFAPGVVPYRVASARAVQAVETVYLKRVKFRAQPSMADLGVPSGADFQVWSQQNPDASTYLSAGVSEWAYRANDKVWLFTIFAVKAGGSDTGPDRFADAILVRADANGKTCVVATVPYKTAFDPAIMAAPPACP